MRSLLTNAAFCRAIVPVTMLLITTLPLHAMDSENPDCTDPVIEYIQTNAESGMSMATIAGDVPLAHTAQFLARDDEGQFVGQDATSQVKRVLQNVEIALSQVGSGLNDLLKLNVYVTGDEIAEEVRESFSNQFSAQRMPAISFVVSNLSHPEALVAIDAVAAACNAEYDRPEMYRVEALGGNPSQGHVAVLPPGGKMYVSGQVAPGDLLTATSGTMESLFATLAYYGLSADDVIQVRAFMPDASRASDVEEEIATYFREDPAPPFVPVEWKDETYLPYLSTEGDDATPIEIEVIAARQKESTDYNGPAPLASHLTYPGLSAPLTYSRAVEYHRGRIVYVSGLYGDPTLDAEGQVREIFDSLDQIMQEAGSSLDNLLKGTYYVAGPEANDWLDTIRGELYDPERAPASAKMPVGAVGREGSVITLDMIGVTP